MEQPRVVRRAHRSRIHVRSPDPLDCDRWYRKRTGRTRATQCATTSTLGTRPSLPATSARARSKSRTSGPRSPPPLLPPVPASHRSRTRMQKTPCRTQHLSCLVSCDGPRTQRAGLRVAHHTVQPLATAASVAFRFAQEGDAARAGGQSSPTHSANVHPLTHVRTGVPRRGREVPRRGSALYPGTPRPCHHARHLPPRGPGALARDPLSLRGAPPLLSTHVSRLLHSPARFEGRSTRADRGVRCEGLGFAVRGCGV